MEKWSNSELIAQWLLAFILIVLTLVILLVVLAKVGMKRIIRAKLEEIQLKLDHQKDLLETSILTQERERERIAADLHDALMGKLISAQLSHNLSDQGQRLSQLLDESIVLTRRISHDLSPPMIEQTMLKDLFQELIEPLKALFTIDFNCFIQTSDNVANSTKIQLTRILQEWLTNIQKHAHATTLSCQLRQSKTSIILLVKDNGLGFDSSKTRTGLGFKNIELRTHYLNGTFRITSSSEKGSRLMVHLPLSKEIAL